MTELLLIDKRDVTIEKAAFAARCHVGTLHPTDLITLAVDPVGVTHHVRVLCTEMRLNENIMVDELDTNYGGLTTLEGSDVAILGPEWMVRTE
jgi:hypothetical protein